MTPPADLTAIVSALGEGEPAHLLLLFDFDGTLSEFAPTPEAAQLPAGRRDLLAQLAERPYTCVGVVSGRRLPDLRAKVGLGAPLLYAGLHGAEIDAFGEQFLNEDVRAGTSLIQQLRPTIEDAVHGLTGIVVEDKQYSVVVHWRLAAGPVKTAASQAVSRALEDVRRRHLVRLQPGHDLCEVLPNATFSKGTAVEWLTRTLKAKRRLTPRTFYAGDDVTDEDAFKAVGAHGVSVLVGRPRPTAARFRLPDPASVEALLRMLVSMPVRALLPGAAHGLAV